MLIENAVVIDYKSGVARVKCQSKSACGSCAAKSECGNAALSELGGGKGEHIFNIATITPLQAGQQVQIGLPERSLLLSVSLVYLLPLVTLLVSALIGEYLFAQELLNALFIFAMTALSFLGLKVYAARLNKKSAYAPILLKVLS
ncbi:RseC/MucC-like positive regulator of sigma(E) [Mesocricetibacter intestinalis]|uniref:RseC/MucC-like positive regulator of sigma(E) n=1 Tax=Mesocricetibacter intestinalis TaxID=1521930 RepID=A0A4R6V748_9PAST|nr:SoxR reducing system RseC family protein [Mesocricetibacter intestinalis]TDQ56632.1 RseC/MucC-like positive regulator of sigma(E) [Mesocricetibacter intestinalis]